MTALGLENLGSESASWLIVTLIGALALMALWSSLTRTSPDRHLASLGPRAKGVFLSIRFRSLGAEAAASQVGHLTELTLGMATFVSPRFLARGDEVELDLATLPGFPALGAQGTKTHAKVVSSRGLGGEPPSYMVTVKLPHFPEPQRRPLVTYIGQLAGTGRLSHA